MQRALDSAVSARIALAAICATAATVVYAKIWDLTFHFDEWAFVLRRRDYDLDAFLEPHNEHLSLIPVAVFKAMLSTVGADPYWPYATLIVVANLACGVLIYRYGRDRVGAVPALCATAVLVLFGPAWNDILMPFQIGFLGSLATGIGMLNALERRRDALASVLLACSLAFSSIGIVFVIAAVVDLLVAREGLRRAVRVVAVPVVLYGAWYLAYGRSSIEIDNAYVALRYAASLISNTLAAAAGLEAGWGPPFALVLAAGTAYALTRPGVPARVWTVASLAVAYPVFTALGRASISPPDASRYLYPTLVFLLLLGFELLRGRRLRPVGAALLVAFTVGAVLSSLNSLKHEPIVKTWASFVAPKLTMVELARGRVAPDFPVDSVRAPEIFAGLYFAAIDEYGSPADSVDEVRRRPPAQRAEADATLLGALRFGIEPEPPSPAAAGPPPAATAVAGTATPSGSCVRFAPGGPDAALEVTGRAPRLLIQAPGGTPVEVRVRRFADGFPDPPTATVGPSRSGVVALPGDRAAIPWNVRLSAPRPFRVCRPR